METNQASEVPAVEVVTFNGQDIPVNALFVSDTDFVMQADENSHAFEFAAGVPRQLPKALIGMALGKGARVHTA